MFDPAALEDRRLLRTAGPRGSSLDAERQRLNPGGAAAIALALERSGRLLLTDDEAARRASAELKVAVTGTIGLIVEAVRAAARRGRWESGAGPGLPLHIQHVDVVRLVPGT